MWTHRLTILVILSLVVLPVLLGGYFAWAGVALQWFSPQTTTTAWVRTTEVVLARGVLLCASDGTTLHVGGPLPKSHFRITRHCVFGLPDIQVALWSFEARPTRGGGGYLVACPIWCLVLPCLIAPVLWLRRRRRSRESRGFDLSVAAVPAKS